MNRKLDEFMDSGASRDKGESPKQAVRKKKRLRETKLDSFLPQEHVDYFKNLRIGAKKIRNAKIEEV